MTFCMLAVFFINEKKKVFQAPKSTPPESVFPQGVVGDVHCVKGNKEAKSNEDLANMCSNHIMHIV